jgi:hypothetical protein
MCSQPPGPVYVFVALLFACVLNILCVWRPPSVHVSAASTASLCQVRFICAAITWKFAPIFEHSANIVFIYPIVSPSLVLSPGFLQACISTSSTGSRLAAAPEPPSCLPPAAVAPLSSPAPFLPAALYNTCQACMHTRRRCYYMIQRLKTGMLSKNTTKLLYLTLWQNQNPSHHHQQ